MPVRSLNSSVLKWPDAQTVKRSLRRWVKKAVRQHPYVVRVGYLGSYARGDWGVGSDLDLVIVVTHAEQPFIQRSAHWDTTELPVPVDVLVYTKEEWESLKQTRLARQNIKWVYRRPN